MSRRRAEVAGAERRRRRRRLLGVAVALVLSAAAAGSFFSPVLDLDRVEIRGVDGPLRAEVRGAAGVSEGEAMVAIDPAQVRSRVERLAFVAHAEVRLHWPDRLVLTVSPHRPVALLADGDAPATDVLTRAGEVVPVAEVEAGGLRVVHLRGSAAALGERDRLALGFLLGSLGPAGSRSLGDLVVDAGGRYRFEGAGPIEGVEVELGELDGLVAKSQALESMLSGVVDLECLATLDVSAPPRVTLARNDTCLRAGGGA